MRKTKARTMVASRKLIREHGLPMKVLAVDPQPGAGKTVIYYSSPETVDFRSLLRDLSATLGSRIELRQLAARDAVRVTGAIGSCGRDTCCSTFLKDYEPITLAMARDQDLPANPMRISGACGRLMCCLKYEHPLYQDFKATDAGDRRGGRFTGRCRAGRRPFGARRIRGHQAGRRRIAPGLPGGIGVRIPQGLRGAAPRPLSDRVACCARCLDRRAFGSDSGQNSDARRAPPANAAAATQIQVGRCFIAPPRVAASYRCVVIAAAVYAGRLLMPDRPGRR